MKRTIFVIFGCTKETPMTREQVYNELKYRPKITSTRERQICEKSFTTAN